VKEKTVKRVEVSTFFYPQYVKIAVDKSSEKGSLL